MELAWQMQPPPGSPRVGQQVPDRLLWNVGACANYPHSIELGPSIETRHTAEKRDEDETVGREKNTETFLLPMSRNRDRPGAPRYFGRFDHPGRPRPALILKHLLHWTDLSMTAESSINIGAMKARMHFAT